MSTKLRRLYLWMESAGLKAEAKSLSELIVKKAITLDELRREFPNLPTTGQPTLPALPNIPGGQQVSLDDLKTLFPDARIGNQVPTTIHELRQQIALPPSADTGVESKILRNSFVLTLSLIHI